MTSTVASNDTNPSALHVERILLPLSGAEKDERAVPVAVTLAERLDAPLTLMSAVSDDVLIDRLERYLARIEAQIEGPATTITVNQGSNPLKTIAAECGPGTLPVMATSGRLLIHDTYLGSAGAWVVRESHRPVVLVGPACEAPLAFDVDRVVVPVDGSILADRAVSVGAQWAEAFSVPLWLVTVFPAVDSPAAVRRPEGGTPIAETNHLQSLATAARRSHPDLDVEWDALHGRDPARTITELAGRSALICMASHGRTGLASIAMGSVARKVARYAAQPVVVSCSPEFGVGV